MANSKTKKKTTKKKSTSASTKKKKTTTKKKSTTKKVSTTKKSTTKKGTPKKVSTPRVVEESSEKEIIELPKYKVKAKEVSTNKNIANRVVSSEEYEGVKKETKKISPKKTTKKYNDKKIAKNKKNTFKKKIDKTIRKIKMYGIESVIPAKYIKIGILTLAIIIILPLFLSLFGNSNKIDLANIPDKIDQLTVVSFEVDDIPGIINSSKAFDSLKSYYEYDFKNMFYLEPSYVSEYSINYNKSKKQVLIAIKPSGDNYDNVKNAIDKFLKEAKITNYNEFYYEGYLIYIKSNSKDNDTIVASKIKQSQKRVFNILKELKKDEIEQTYGISDSYYDEALVKNAMIVKSDTCEYAIFKPKNDNTKVKIKNAMDEYYKGLETKWANNEDNLRLIQNRYFEEYEGYLIFIVSHDNDMVKDLIKKS